MTKTTMPPPSAVGIRAKQIIDRIRADEEFPRLESSSKRYADCWATYTGYPLIAQWNLDTDASPLFAEGLKVLALKAAVHEMTGDEKAAELLVSLPVDEMVHAIIAQASLCKRIFERVGITCVHQTDHEEFGWTWGDYTTQCYLEAGWGTLPERYWIDAAETTRRRAFLNNQYARIGIKADGRAHTLDFAEPELALV